MPEAVVQGAGAAGLVTFIRIDDVFDDPGVIRRLVQRNGPYRTMVSYLPASAVRGGQPAAADGVPRISGQPGRRAAARWWTGPRLSSTTPACCAQPRNFLTPK